MANKWLERTSFIVLNQKTIPVVLLAESSDILPSILIRTC